MAHDKRGKLSLLLPVVVELHYRMILRMMRKMPVVMNDRDTLYMLSGVVKMDDMPLSKDECSRLQYLRIQVIDKVSTEEITRVAKACVEPGSTITSDASKFEKLSCLTSEGSDRAGS